MKWLLDTNVCIDVLRGREDVIRCFKECSPDDVAVSAVTGFELIQGAGRAPKGLRDEERRKVSAFLARLKQIPFDEDCGRIAGEMNAGLLNRGTPVSVTDVFIAATAVSLGVPVVTSNLRDFQKIEGVEVMDWTGGVAEDREVLPA